MTYPSKYLVVGSADLPAGIKPQGTPNAVTGRFYAMWWDGTNAYCSSDLTSEEYASVMIGKCPDYRITYRANKGELVTIREGGEFVTFDS